MNFINKNFNYIVIWASNNKNKYWYKVFKDLLEKWFNVFPVNPNTDTILWIKTFKNINEIHIKIDVAIFILPPNIWENILKDVIKKWINKIRLQEWAENNNMINYCKKYNIDCIHNACIMINSNFNS